MSENLLGKRSILVNHIQEYLKRGNIIDFEKLIPYIKERSSKSSININENGIRYILKSLFKNNYIVQGTKFTRDCVLNNSNRKKLYITIIQNPGLYFSRLVKMLNLSNHVVAWHINTLYKFGFIKKETIDNHEVYFDSKLESIYTKAYYLLQKPKSKEIIECLINEHNLGITKTRISNIIKTHYNIVSKYIENLEDIGIIERKKESDKTLYFLNKDQYNRYKNSKL